MKKPSLSWFSATTRIAVTPSLTALVCVPPDTPRIEWVEAATGFGVRDAFDQQDFAVLILDAEAKKEGGMSIAQDLRETRDGVPPIVFLTARAQDEWLATWAGAAAVVADPIDPIILQETVADVLRGAK